MFRGFSVSKINRLIYDAFNGHLSSNLGFTQAPRFKKKHSCEAEFSLKLVCCENIVVRAKRWRKCSLVVQPVLEGRT